MDNKENGAVLDRRSFLKSAGGTAALVASRSSSASQAVPQREASPSATGQGMRIPVISPKDYTLEQQELYKTLHASIEKYLQGFVTARADGGANRPIGYPATLPATRSGDLECVHRARGGKALPSLAREVAIRSTGAHSCMYERYSHKAVALRKGLSETKIETIAVGQRPGDLTREEALGYYITSLLNLGKRIPQSTYNAAVKVFSEQGVAELVTTVGCYSTICVLLNAFDVSLPGTELGGAAPGQEPQP